MPTPKVPFDTGISKKHPDQLAAALAAGRGVMLAAWQHEAMADICAALGKLIPFSGGCSTPCVRTGTFPDVTPTRPNLRACYPAKTK